MIFFCLPLIVNYGFSHLYLVCFSINIKIFIGFHSACLFFLGEGEGGESARGEIFCLSREKKMEKCFQLKLFTLARDVVVDKRNVFLSC